MKVVKTPFEGLLIIEPDVYRDNRGFFFESYNYKHFNALGITDHFVQDNQSWSKKNVIRGLHCQIPPHVQTKLIRSLRGVILDVVVDLRKSQPTFGKTFTIELSSDNKKQLLVPKGFLHGFSVLSDEAEILYKCDDFYHPECERGIRYDDPDFSIDWQCDKGMELISSKDLSLPYQKVSQLQF